MKKKYYIFTAVIAYLILLIVTIPANSIVKLINDNAHLTIQGVSGTLWSGNADVISINNSTQLNKTQWSFTLWRLLLGQLAAEVNTRYADHNINAEIGTSLLGRYFVNNLTGTVSAEEVARLANIPLAQLSGLISLNIEHAQWKRGELPLATGEINWNEATITVAETASLGDISITLGESEQQLLNADIKNQGGDIRINGIAELVPDANYSVNLKLLPTASANDGVQQSLGLFAKRQANGEYLFKNSGPLKQIGLM